MRIGYAKVGRSWNLDPAKWSALGGDMDVWRFLDRLARLRPADEIVLVGRNSGEEPTTVGLPANVINPWTALRAEYSAAQKTWKPSGKAITAEGQQTVIKWFDAHTIEMFRELDSLIVWAGQQGTSNSPIPPIHGAWDKLTNPQDSSVLYASYVVRGINAFRAADPLKREEVWLCPDPRNYIKARDLKWPLLHPVLAQYVEERRTKFERYGDPRTPQECGFSKTEVDGTVWVRKVPYIYSALELTMLPDPDTLPVNNEPGAWPFGLIVNENRPYVTHSRLAAIKEWVLPWYPDVPIYGKWTEKAETEIGRKIDAVPVRQMYDVLRNFRCTFTMPASGTRWATGKPWEAFATGVVCFFHPMYDAQGHIIPTLAQVKAGGVPEWLAHLATWLRVQTPEELQQRVCTMTDESWRWIVQAQRMHFEQRFNDRLVERLVMERLCV